LFFGDKKWGKRRGGDLHKKKVNQEKGVGVLKIQEGWKGNQKNSDIFTSIGHKTYP